jgi:hypothetical protein
LTGARGYYGPKPSGTSAVTWGTAIEVSIAVAAFSIVVVSPSVISGPDTTVVEPLSLLSPIVKAPMAATALAPTVAETSFNFREVMTENSNQL